MKNPSLFDTVLVKRLKSTSTANSHRVAPLNITYASHFPASLQRHQPNEAASRVLLARQDAPLNALSTAYCSSYVPRCRFLERLDFSK